ncbi:MAG: CHAD domain-containing protein [Chlorobiales bacterium]|nr:CHAD domain-containing protein [Chlorobiales bacterium]
MAGRADTLGRRTHQAIGKQYKKILRYEAGVLEDRDPEELHQMRVNMRRLRSIAEGFSSILELPKHASEKRIAKFSRTLGQLRDLDVLIDTLQKDYFPKLTDKEKPHYINILSALEERRTKSLEDVRQLLVSKEYLEFKSSLEGWITKPVLFGVARLPVTLVLPDFLFPMVTRLMINPGWLVGLSVRNGELHPSTNRSPVAVNRLLCKQGSVLHSLRKQVKRVRYQMSFFTDLYGEALGRYIEDMKNFQETLGTIQDSLVLEALFCEILGTRFKRQLPTAVKQLADGRYEAWQNWDALRNRYMLEETRQAFRLELLKMNTSAYSLPVR